MTNAQIAHQFLAIDPQKSQARMAFYHFLKNFTNLDEEFKAETIDMFYDRALSLQYWQNNKRQLGEEIQDDLAAICSRNPLSFDHEQIIHAHELQAITVEHPRDFAALLARDIKKLEDRGEKIKGFRLTQDHPTSHQQEVMLLRLQKSGQIIVEIRQNTAILVDGELHLVRPHSRLTYTSDLDFAPHIDQFLNTSVMRTARFKAMPSGGKLRGCFIQGASFHCAETFDRRLEDVPELFQAVKRIERFYVNPVTDPYYHQMIETFEQAQYEQIREKQAEKNI
jgi:hypothetical protein